ncbi:MAG: TIM barrel protein [Spirochaetaceae bacterium]|nr:MAG: TIM barrel protein [Spirochaetaceae bacterium]
MLQRAQISLNRIAYPNIDLKEFLALAHELDLRMVELRNDLPGGGIIDDMEPEEVLELAARFELSIVTINALQKFNLLDHLPAALRELEVLLDLAVAIRCPAIVLCPLNDSADTRDAQQRYEETVRCLQAFQPMFADTSLMGYVEPLGFSESSLSSLISAQTAIRESGASCYRIVYDTFHHFIGPESAEQLGTKLDIGLIGLIHASGVTADLPRSQYRDEHRGFITPEDRFENLEQIESLLKRGFSGTVSLEPFSTLVQKLSKVQFKTEMERSLDHLIGGL